MSIKLSWEKVRSMRRSYAMGMSQVQLSREFNMSVIQVGRIVNNLSWKQENIPLDEMTKQEQYKLTCDNWKREMGEDYSLSFDQWLEIRAKAMSDRAANGR